MSSHSDVSSGNSGGCALRRSEELSVTTERPSLVCTVQTAGL